LDQNANLSGACSTSGLAFKMKGRVGDSPIIGAGLYVDNEVGAATATGLGESVVKKVGAFSIVEMMRQGMHPEKACKEAAKRLLTVKTKEEFQVGYIAMNKKGEIGAFALRQGFQASLMSPEGFKLIQSDFIL
jgi:N4-(beta-N-acetylglucosaminyl)-L-asparaginase